MIRLIFTAAIAISAQTPAVLAQDHSHNDLSARALWSSLVVSEKSDEVIAANFRVAVSQAEKKAPVYVLFADRYADIVFATAVRQAFEE